MIKRARASHCLRNLSVSRSAKNEKKKMNDARRSVAPPEVDWEHLDKKKFLLLGAAVFSVRCRCPKQAASEDARGKRWN